MLDAELPSELVSGGDTLLHYHLADRGPFPIPSGYFYDTTTQTAAVANTAYLATFNSSSYMLGVSYAAGKFTAKRPGYYHFSLSIQFSSSSSQDYDANVWVRKNGTNLANSNTILSIPAKHGAIHGHVLSAWGGTIQISRNDYIELYWSTENTAVHMEYAAAAAPAPATASATLSMVLVSI